jgi:hypothetical protein
MPIVSMDAGVHRCHNREDTTPRRREGLKDEALGTGTWH